MTERDADHYFRLVDAILDGSGVPPIRAVEPIRGNSECALEQLLELVAKAQNGEIRSLACAWEEVDGVSSSYTRERDGSLLLLHGALSLVKGDVKSQIRKEREEEK